MIRSSREEVNLRAQSTFPISHQEIESREKQTPSRLPAIELLGHQEVLKILVIRKNLKTLLSAFQIMTPVFKATHDREHFSIIDFVISFDFIEGLGNEGAGIPFLVVLKNTEDISSSEARRVSFNSEGFRGIRVMEDRFGGETLLEVVEHKFFVFAPLPFLILSR